MKTVLPASVVTIGYTLLAVMYGVATMRNVGKSRVCIHTSFALGRLRLDIARHFTSIGTVISAVGNS